MPARVWGFESPLPHFCDVNGPYGEGDDDSEPCAAEYAEKQLKVLHSFFVVRFCSNNRPMPAHNSRINVLPQTVTEKIAAGEVVERPASVVKELVENALDAGATRIEITVEDAGFGLMRVSDNGTGMPPEDLQKCMLSHATSKITDADDLFCVATLGFRGEALASIGAVSRLGITSSGADDGLGHTIKSDGGALSAISPAPHTRGTTVVCRDLFFNVPARKKFMKSERAERTALLRFIEQLVIPFPSVHFSVTMEGKKALEAPAVDSPRERIAQVAGTEFAKELLSCAGERDGMAATIYLSPPHAASARPRYQYLYVNLRRVDSDPVSFGIREAFSRFITDKLRPAWFCFLETDPRRVDVNVHPTKQRVKFDDERAMFGFAYHVVESCIPKASGMEPRASAGPATGAGADAPLGARTGTAGAGKVMESASSYAPGRSRPNDAVQTSLTFLSLSQDAAGGEKELELNLDGRVQLRDEQWELIPCYQIHGLFVLAPIKNGILLIDQHAAHERVLYEQALEDLKHGRAESQRLLFPIVIELSMVEKTAIVAGREYFNALGFEVQDFGGQSIAVSAIPAAGFMRESGIEEAVREMIGYLMEGTDTGLLSEPQKRYAAAFACGAAVKAGQKLKQEEMNSLLNSLFAAESPFVCPHGRPTCVRISLDELRRRFLR
ncbi:MAG: DNA mismatch repair endonuclease MutL [Chitinivibrionales bacterium]|nr:DNA mismatch repair endonuclease MutL [Chitinivibrionales bacterium]MBD3396222.1 DNA mismatch repair endonuclease MutL [Chitinivibrionales bacterium]